MTSSSIPPTPQFFIKIAPPLVTRILIGVNLAIFVAMIFYGYVTYGTWNGTEDLRVLIDFGAKENSRIAQGEIWRLFSAMFLHIGVLHLLFNLYALNALGPMVEGYFGHIRFTSIYIIGGLFGSMASYAFSQSVSAGASGAIFGLAGTLIVYFLRYRDNFGQRGRAILQNMLIVIGINLIFGLSSAGIDNWGHVGGLLGGALVAWGLLPRYQRPSVIPLGPQPLPEEDRQTPELVWTGICVVILWLLFQWASSNL